MAHLVDSNVLLRRQEPKHPHFQAADGAVGRLQRRNERLCVARQNLIEFRNVASRPLDKNGLGLTPAEADLELDDVEQELDILSDNDRIYAVWRKLIAAKAVSGKQVHDARLVAVMLTYGITHLLTFNVQDFLRFQTLPPEISPGIVVVAPSEV